MASGIVAGCSVAASRTANKLSRNFAADNIGCRYAVPATIVDFGNCRNSLQCGQFVTAA